MTVQFEVGSEPVVINAELSNYPDTTFGETTTYELLLTSDATGTPAGYSTVRERYDRLKEYLKYAGKTVTGRTNSSVYFSEQADFSRTDVNTLLVKISPGSGIEEARGIWGVIVGGQDETEIFGAQARLTLEVFVLAEADDYSTVSDVRAAFEYSV